MRKRRLKEMMEEVREANERTMRLAQELEEERYTLQTIFDTIPDIVFIKDANLKITRCNQSFLDFFHVTEEDIIGSDEASIGVPEEIMEEYRAADKIVLKNNKLFIAEETVPSPDAGLRLFETIKVPLIKHGEVTGLMGIARDITERKSMEKTAQSANRSKSVFLANMSHEIRTPMNSILGFSELALNDSIPRQTREYLVNIYDSAEWLLKIINDILDISKIESGKIELESIPFDLPEIFDYCQAAIKARAVEKGVTLYCYAEPSAGKKLVGDPVRLRQIIVNLLSNAVKFTDSGTIKLLASVVDSDENSAVINFEVKDSGIGMNPEQIERIFMPFAQAEDSITRRYGGTGLGLTITKNIIELMGGKLEVYSESGLGTRFSFEIKFDLISDSEIPHDEIEINEFKRPVFNGEVLVCEDNSLNRQMIRDNLERIGLKVVMAHDGKDGVEIIEERLEKNEKPFDLIFMDIHMPVMDGLDAAAKISEMGVKTPIIALTANVMSNDLKLYKAGGMKDTIGKPFTSKDLWRCMAKYLPVERYTTIDAKVLAAEESRLKNKVKVDFAKNNNKTYENIVSAVSERNFALAYRLVHTLKSNAGQIGYTKLQAVAAKVENALKSGEIKLNTSCVDDIRMQELEIELSLALNDLAPLLQESRKPVEASVTGIDKVLELLTALEPLLKMKDTRCLELMDELGAVPGTEELVELIEGYKFKQAIILMGKVREKLESENE